MFNFKKKKEQQVKERERIAKKNPGLRTLPEEVRGYKVEFIIRFNNIIEGSSVINSYARTKTINALVGEEHIAQIILREIKRNERFCLRSGQIPDKIQLELRYIQYSPVVSTVIATRKVEYQARTDIKRFKRSYIAKYIKD